MGETTEPGGAGGAGGPVVGVLGGSGGVGASTFAAVLALTAGPSVLVDLDVCGGGIDVVLGVESVPGARWSGLEVAGGRLEPATLAAGLPHAGSCAVLAADTAELDPDAVRQVLAAAAAAGAVVVDLPRARCAERAAALLLCDLVVVLARADVGGLVAAHAVVAELPELAVGVVVRRGRVQPTQAAELIGAPLLGELGPLGAAQPLDPRRLPRSLVRVASGVLGGLRRPGAGMGAAS
ncbi:MAG TPA: hypothetical protein VFH38_08750 [Jatrophihabitans sp.]|nr:hypothetical protein [Jatrophihabitans sp.]